MKSFNNSCDHTANFSDGTRVSEIHHQCQRFRLNNISNFCLPPKRKLPSILFILPNTDRFTFPGLKKWQTKNERERVREID